MFSADFDTPPSTLAIAEALSDIKHKIFTNFTYLIKMLHKFYFLSLIEKVIFYLLLLIIPILLAVLTFFISCKSQVNKI